MYAVIMIEEPMPGETLTVSQCINEVIGPFATEKDATDWAVRFQRIATLGNEFLGIRPTVQYHITHITDPMTLLEKV